MKFIIGVDLEGVGGVVGKPREAFGDSPDEYDFGRLQGTREADAAAKALFDSGAEQVIIWDNHAGWANLFYDKLDKRCDLLIGRVVEHRWGVLDESFTGVLLIGYHAMDNTSDAVLAHSFSSKSFTWMKVNGEEVGEMEIDAAVAGEQGVPVIFAASDDKGISEAKRFFPWIETVATKTGLGRNIALCKQPDRVLDEIYEGVKKAVERLRDMRTFGFDTQLSFQTCYKRMEDVEAVIRSKAGWALIDPYTIEKRFNKISERF